MSDLIKRQDVIDVVMKSYLYESDRMTDLQEIPTAYNVEAVLQSVKDIGTRFCTHVHCENECANCDHGAIMKAIISEIEKGGANKSTGRNEV